MPAISKVLFILAVLISGSGLVSPPVALTAGTVFGLSFAHPYSSWSRISARILLQAAVVALGFGMNLHDVIKAGRSGFLYTALGICFALAVGLALGKLLEVRGNSSYLITAGTAICGGSAIAAVGPILHANEEEMAVSLGTIFILNSVALLIFPPIGVLLHLSQSQFGLWAALAIHDTQLGRWRLRALRHPGARHWHDCKARSRSMDRSSRPGHRCAYARAISTPRQQFRIFA